MYLKNAIHYLVQKVTVQLRVAICSVINNNINKFNNECLYNTLKKIEYYIIYMNYSHCFIPFGNIHKD